MEGTNIVGTRKGGRGGRMGHWGWPFTLLMVRTQACNADNPNDPEQSFRVMPGLVVDFVGIYYSVFGSTCLPNHSYIAVYFPLVLLQ